ncbi:MAG: DUF2877 domain-containing protein, partial [Fervidicoccaceae archaeon]
EHVFRTTVYLRNIKDDGLVLISAHRWRSPFTINVPLSPLDTFFLPGEILEVTSEAIRGNSTKILLTEAELYRQKEPEIEECRGIEEEDFKFLKGAFVVLSTAWNNFFGSETMRRICKNRDFLTSGSALKEIIGAGGGFTPSGDDFLAGMLSLFSIARKCASFDESYFPKIDKELLRRTSWASSQYIKYASMGLLDELVLDSAVSLLRGDEQDAYDLFLQLLRRGHDSGLYIWLGLITAYSIYKYRRVLFLEHVCKVMPVDG